MALVHPELLGTYGDGGNAMVLAKRLAWRGIAAEVVEVPAGCPVPSSCDVYCLGGGEDGPQTRAAAELGAGGAGKPAMVEAVEQGAVVLAVCAGYQIVGASFEVAPADAGTGGAVRQRGLGLLDVETLRLPMPRAVGEVVSAEGGGFALGVLTGYENHGSSTLLGPSARPLGTVVSGTGNGGTQRRAGPRTEGAVSGRVVGTYMHGPVLARNPALADLLLSWVVGPLSPLDDSEVSELRKERLSALPLTTAASAGGSRIGASAERLLARWLGPSRARRLAKARRW
ncbi:MAG: type 1 glutamine amidotransferase [Acidimicrobiales bacterium]